ncbi:MAG: DUF4387 family protein [Candidatus Nanopelagicales bacterium]
MLLRDAASIVRSKNAGPFWLTVDVFFTDADAFEAAQSSALLTVAGVAAAYGVPAESVKGVFWDERVRGVKVSLLRWSSSSDPFCSDLFGAHLHSPLADSELV